MFDDHDPLCRSRGERVGLCLVCDLIAKVRADEREFLAPEVPMARDDLRNELRAKVEALPTRGIGARVVDDELETFGLVERNEVLALFDGSSNV